VQERSETMTKKKNANDKLKSWIDGIGDFKEEADKMADTTGMEIMYTVIKNDDLETYLDDNDRNTFYYLVEDKIEYTRKLQGKKENTYLVINTDEPYAEEVIEILKRNGHWG
jgi:hypothetical protein